MNKNLEQINPNPEIIFPKDLTPKDIELVREQCEIQHATSKEQIEGFASAYSDAKRLALNEKELSLLTPENVKKLILKLGVIIEKKENKNGFRLVPVTFEDTSKALDARLINQAIDSFSQNFLAFLENPVEDERFNTTNLYTEFEKIHPFNDGNGRVGDLLWKILETKKNGSWPETMPPDVFGK